MKKPISIFLFSLASAATLPAAVTITVANNVPNGTASGGTGTAPDPGGLLSTSLGTITSNRGLPVTSYTVSGIDLTSVGGTTSESFTFTVGYTQLNGTGVQFNGFGNVSVTGNSDNNNINGTESLTATITLTSTTFTNLSLVGLTLARAGGVVGVETGTFTWTGGSFNVSSGNTIANSVTGNSFTLTAGSGSAINIEGFGAQFVAVPEPASTSLLALGTVALLRRRRIAK